MKKETARDWWNLDEKSATHRFLRKHQVTGDTTARISHASMTMGRYYVPDERMPELWAAMAEDMQGRGEDQQDRFAPPLSEQHTRLFNFYLDLDMQFPCAQLPQDGLMAMARILKEETRRFFPNSEEYHDRLRILVCTKSRGFGKPLPVKQLAEWEVFDGSGGVEIKGDDGSAARLLREAYELADADRRTVAIQLSHWASATKHGTGGGDAYEGPGGVWVRDHADHAVVRFRLVDAAPASAEPVFGEPRRLLQELTASRAACSRFSVSEAVARELGGMSLLSDCAVRVDDGLWARPVTRLFKHGVHVHWSPCVVDVARAYQMRKGVVLAFARHAHRLQDCFGLELGEAEWDEIVDESVYNTGLRMIGAPKAVQVRTHGAAVPYRYQKTNSETNQTKFFAVDPQAYDVHLMLRGDEVVDYFGTCDLQERRETHFIKFTTQALRETSVRCRDDVELTPNFFAHSGLHTVTQPAPGGAGKRKRGAKPGDEKKTLGKDYAASVAVTDPAKLQILRKCLLEHSAEYKDCEIKAFAHPKKTEMRVQLSNIGCTYCLNKGGFHSRNRVYMLVYGSADKTPVAVSHMQCWSTKEQLCGVSCKGFKSQSKRSTPEEHARLFQRSDATAPASAAASSSSAVSTAIVEVDDKVEQDLPSVKDNKAGRKIAAALAALKASR